ncbi:MAG: condensation domain-containing protein [Bacteroidota bacterium]
MGYTPVHQQVAQQAMKTPHALALQTAEGAVTYEALNQQADALGRILDTLKIQEKAVGVFLPAGTHMIQTLLGVFKAGGVYLPVDPAFSHQRWLQVIDKAECEYFITLPAWQAQLAQTLQAIDREATQLILEEDHLQVIDGEAYAYAEYAGSFALDLEEDASNYLFYTSGTTGTPKAMLGRHDSLAQFIEWERNEFGLESAQHVSMLIQPVFDASMRDIFYPLCSGGTLHIPGPGIRDNIAQLMLWLDEQEITHVHIGPAIFRLMLKNLDILPGSKKLPKLQHVLLAGEPLYARDAQQWNEGVGKHAQLVNLYGASESTMIKTFHRITEIPENPAHPLHVGHPIEKAFVIILNAKGELCRIGEVGDIYIKSHYLTKGYFNDPEKTAKAFVQNPMTDTPEIVYKTGDLGSYRKDRSLELAGRKDDIVKVNGFGVSLKEVERALLGYGNIYQVVVLKHDDTQAGSDLVCYYTGVEHAPGDLKEYFRTQINDKLIPSYFIHMEEFPLTINGKVNKRALPKPQHVKNTIKNLPRNEVEQKLTAIWSEVLGVESVDTAARFFEIGGTSVKALQALARIFTAFQVEVPLADLFDNLSIQELALRVDELKSTRDQLNPLEEQDYYPLSLGQQQLWALNTLGHHDSSEEDTRARRNLFRMGYFQASLDIEKVEAVIRTLLVRHEGLRTSFQLHAGQVIQRVWEPGTVTPKFAYTDLSGDPDQESKLHHLQQEVKGSAFDFAQPPLLATHLIKLEPEKYCFLFAIHPLIADGHSLKIIQEELLTIYEGGSPTPLPIQYKDYLLWQSDQLTEGGIATQRQYWLDTLQAPLPELSIPTDYERGHNPSFEGSRWKFALTEEQKQKVDALTQSLQITTLSVGLGVYALLLSRLSNQTDIIIGLPVAGRIRLVLEQVVGRMLNTLPIRISVDPSLTVQEYLKEVKNRIFKGFENQEYPIDKMVEDQGPGRKRDHPLFSTALIYEHTEYARDAAVFGGSVSQERQRYALNELSLLLIEGPNLITGQIEYDISLFSEATARQMVDFYLELLNQMVEDPAQPLSHLKILKQQEASPELDFDLEFDF